VNVTPFIDVMLVLLIVFMVAAPLATVAVPLDLSVPDGPQSAAEPVFVSLQENGVINVGTERTGEIVRKLGDAWSSATAKDGREPHGPTVRARRPERRLCRRDAFDGCAPPWRLQGQDVGVRGRHRLSLVPQGFPTFSNRSR
jgi:hypothetical protein